MAYEKEIVSGDAEGGIEMTRSMVLVRDFCCGFLENEKYARTRIVSIALRL